MSNSSSVEQQLREWVGQLGPEHRQLLLMMLTEDDQLQGSARLDFAVSQLRKLCKQRGFDWDRMAESDRESFLDNLIRETELYATQAGAPSIVPVLPCSCCGRDVTPSDLYRIYFGERPPSVEVAIAKLILLDMDISAQFYIEDLGSANGSFVNGRTRLKPQEPYPLVNGDVLKIGETTLKFAV